MFSGDYRLDHTRSSVLQIGERFAKSRLLLSPLPRAVLIVAPDRQMHPALRCRHRNGCIPFCSFFVLRFRCNALG